MNCIDTFPATAATATCVTKAARSFKKSKKEAKACSVKCALPADNNVASAPATILPPEHEAVRQILNAGHSDEKKAIDGWLKLKRWLTDSDKDLTHVLLMSDTEKLYDTHPIELWLSKAIRVIIYSLYQSQLMVVEVQCSKFCRMEAMFDHGGYYPTGVNICFLDYIRLEKYNEQISRAMYCALFIPDANPVYFAEAFQALDEKYARGDVSDGDGGERMNTDSSRAVERWNGQSLILDRKERSFTVIEPDNDAPRKPTCLTYFHPALNGKWRASNQDFRIHRMVLSET